MVNTSHDRVRSNRGEEMDWLLNRRSHTLILALAYDLWSSASISRSVRLLWVDSSGSYTLLNVMTLEVRPDYGLITLSWDSPLCTVTCVVDLVANAILCGYEVLGRIWEVVSASTCRPDSQQIGNRWIWKESMATWLPLLHADWVRCAPQIRSRLHVIVMNPGYLLGNISWKQPM